MNEHQDIMDELSKLQKEVEDMRRVMSRPCKHQSPTGWYVGDLPDAYPFKYPQTLWNGTGVS